MSSGDARLSGRNSGHGGESDRPPTWPGLAAMPLIGGHEETLKIHLPVPTRPHPRPRPPPPASTRYNRFRDDVELVSECELSE